MQVPPTDELHMTGASVFRHIGADIKEARKHSANYNRCRLNAETEDLTGLVDILRWIRENSPASTPQGRSAFMTKVFEMIEDFDQAPYLMRPSMEKLVAELDKDVPVEVFLYILLCPLGCCAGVSRDTITGSYFSTIEEPCNRGMSFHCLIL